MRHFPHPIIFFLFLPILILSCSNTMPSRAVISPSFNEGDSLQPFLDAGCQQGNTSEYVLKCQDTELISTFDCLPNLYVREEGGAFGIFLATCFTRATQMPIEKQKEYFSCDGGFFYSCKSYISWKNGQFIQIKNKKELAPLVSPINTTEEAMNYVLLVEDGTQNITLNETLFEQRTKKIEDTFLVTIYAPDRTYGCFDTIHYEAIQYEVAANGDITERNRTVVYTRKLPGMICAD